MDWPIQDPFNGKGFLIQNDPHKRVWVHFNEAEGRFEQCTEEYTDPLWGENRRHLNESQGQRWGDGRRVASMPLAWYFRNILPAQQNGDQEYIKRKLNDSDFRDMRTFKGRL